MKKILVPTDFSANAKSGIRFAINWSRQQPLELVFIHVLHLLRPTLWNDATFAAYAKAEENKYREKFEQYIADLYDSMQVKPGRHTLTIIQGISPDVAILEYCRKNKHIDYICISTRGAGKFKKIFGTNTSNLITKSPVPVVAVPASYKVADVTQVLYATDFRNYSAELKKVIDFSRPLKASIDVLHFTWPSEIDFDEKTLKAAFKKQYQYGLQLHLEKTDVVYTLLQHLQNEIRLRKPSVVILFTNQQRTFFQKLFMSSQAENLSFNLSVPLLVFSKD